MSSVCLLQHLCLYGGGICTSCCCCCGGGRSVSNRWTESLISLSRHVTLCRIVTAPNCCPFRQWIRLSASAHQRCFRRLSIWRRYRLVYSIDGREGRRVGRSSSVVNAGRRGRDRDRDRPSRSPCVARINAVHQTECWRHQVVTWHTRTL